MDRWIASPMDPDQISSYGGWGRGGKAKILPGRATEKHSSSLLRVKITGVWGSRACETLTQNFERKTDCFAVYWGE